MGSSFGPSSDDDAQLTDSPSDVRIDCQAFRSQLLFFAVSEMSIIDPMCARFPNGGIHLKWECVFWGAGGKIGNPFWVEGKLREIPLWPKGGTHFFGRPKAINHLHGLPPVLLLHVRDWIRARAARRDSPQSCDSTAQSDQSHLKFGVVAKNGVASPVAEVSVQPAVVPAIGRLGH